MKRGATQLDRHEKQLFAKHRVPIQGTRSRGTSLMRNSGSAPYVCKNPHPRTCVQDNLYCVAETEAQFI